MYPQHHSTALLLTSVPYNYRIKCNYDVDIINYETLSNHLGTLVTALEMTTEW